MVKRSKLPSNRGETNPIKKPKKKSIPEGDYITFDTFQKIVDKEPQRNYKLIFSMLWYMGLRVSECLNIKRQDIDKEKPESVDLPKNTHTVAIWRKNNHFAMLPLPPFLYSEIMKYCKDYKIAREQKLFQITRTAVYLRLTNYGFTIGGKKRIHPHALRKGFGIWLRSKGGLSMEHLQRAYSHESMQTTIRYLGLDRSKAISDIANYYNSLNSNT